MADERDGEMWFCPDCELWIGSKLDKCKDRHSRPRFEIRTGDVRGFVDPQASTVSRAGRLVRASWAIHGVVRSLLERSA